LALLPLTIYSELVCCYVDEIAIYLEYLNLLSIFLMPTVNGFQKL